MYKTYFSPAKINLFFKVLFKREDNFHEIFSLMQTLNLVDIINIKFSKKDKIVCKKYPYLEKSNLILKAIGLFRKKTLSNFYVDIILDKKIPISSGLGGGSSNAATILWALNEMDNFSLSLEDLKILGSKIGSDVPFFFSEGIALCSGRGEKIENMNRVNFSCVLAKPKFGISTKEVYENLKIEDRKKDFFMNDLEKPAFSLNPSLIKIKKDLYRSGFEKVCMTGSGSTFFCFGKKNKKSNLKKIDFYDVETIFREKNRWYNE